LQAIQGRTLAILFTSDRLMRMSDHTSLYPSTAYALPSFFSDIDQIITRDLTSSPDAYRRNLHRALIDVYEGLMNSNELQRSDVPLLARGSLKSIKARAASAAGQGGVAGMHADDMVARIDEILDND